MPVLIKNKKTIKDFYLSHNNNYNLITLSVFLLWEIKNYYFINENHGGVIIFLYSLKLFSLAF